MLRKDVVGLFNSLIRHGVKPPCDMQDKEAQQKLISEYFDKLQYLSDAEFREVMERAPLVPHWPTLDDLNEIVTNYRRDELAKQFGSKRKGAVKRDQECIGALGHMPPLGETWVQAMAKKAAKRHFPEASKEFVEENKVLLAAHCEWDYMCDTCYGKSVHECKTGGHRPFMMIEPNSGVLLDCVDCELCGKVLIAPKEEKRGGRE